MAKKDLIDAPAADASAPAPGADAAVPNPHAGGSYSRDPATGELTLVRAATRPSVARKVQDPVTGVITRIVDKE